MYLALNSPCPHCEGTAKIHEVLDEDQYTILGLMAKCSACGIRTAVYQTAEAARIAWERTPPSLATPVLPLPCTGPVAGQGSRRASLFPGRARNLRAVIREHLRKRNLTIKGDLAQMLGMSANGAASLMTKPCKFAPRHVERIISRLRLNQESARELRMLGAIEAGWALEPLVGIKPGRQHSQLHSTN